MNLVKHYQQKKTSVFFKILKEAEVLEIHFKEIYDLIDALVHDLGKGLTPKEEYPHHYGHEIKGIDVVVKFGNRIKAPTKWIQSGKVACREHMRGGIFYKMKASKKVEFIERVAKSSIGLHGLQIVVYSDKLSSRNIDSGSIDFETIGKECLEEVNGKYIKEKYNISEGIEFGNKLHQERIEWMKNTNTQKREP